jgi:hypothetical protein
MGSGWGPKRRSRQVHSRHVQPAKPLALQGLHGTPCDSARGSKALSAARNEGVPASNPGVGFAERPASSGFSRSWGLAGARCCRARATERATAAPRWQPRARAWQAAWGRLGLALARWRLGHSDPAFTQRVYIHTKDAPRFDDLDTDISVVGPE